MILYFSGTGNSRWVAEMLAVRTGDEMYAMADVVAGTLQLRLLTEEESLGFVFPVYGWMPPAMVRKTIEALSDAHAPKYLYFVCTCGDDAGKATRVFARWLVEKGWHCDAGFSVVMPNTYVCLPGFNVDAEDVEHQKLVAAMSRMEVVASVVTDKGRVVDCHEGAFPWLKTYVLGWFFGHFLMSPRLFLATSDCVACGKCEMVCPLHNIRMKDGRPKWGNDCAMCLSCYHHCPRHAVAYGKRTRGKGQYVFPPTVWKVGKE